MKELIELVTKYDVVEIIIFLVLAFLAFKGCYEGYHWVKDLMDKWRTGQNAQERRESDIQSRLETLEKHDREQYEQMIDLTNAVNMVCSEIKEMKDNQTQKELKDRFDHARKTILSSANKLKNSNVLTSDMYKEVYDAYDDYSYLVEHHGFKNGRVEASMKLINQRYMTDSILDDEE